MDDETRQRVSEKEREESLDPRRTRVDVLRARKSFEGPLCLRSRGLSHQHQLSDRWSTHSTDSVMHIFSYEHFHSGLYAIFSSVLITAPRVFQTRPRVGRTFWSSQHIRLATSEVLIPTFLLTSPCKFLASKVRLLRSVLLTWIVHCVIQLERR